MTHAEKIKKTFADMRINMPPYRNAPGYPKVLDGPFTGKELSDGFTREEDEEAALQEEVDNFSA